MQERAHLEGLNRQLPLTDRRPTRTKGGGALEPGDVLIVTRLDRLARSRRDWLNVLDAVAKAKAGFRSLKDTWADTTTTAWPTNAEPCTSAIVIVATGSRCG